MRPTLTTASPAAGAVKVHGDGRDLGYYVQGNLLRDPGGGIKSPKQVSSIVPPSRHRHGYAPDTVPLRSVVPAAWQFEKDVPSGRRVVEPASGTVRLGEGGRCPTPSGPAPSSLGRARFRRLRLHARPGPAFPPRSNPPGPTPGPGPSGLRYNPSGRAARARVHRRGTTSCLTPTRPGRAMGLGPGGSTRR